MENNWQTVVVLLPEANWQYGVPMILQYPYVPSDYDQTAVVKAKVPS